MGHTLSERRRRQRMQEFGREHVAAARVRGARDCARARSLVSLWNSELQRRVHPSFYPTIWTAIIAGYPVLEAVCPACRRIGAIDLRKLDRHPHASVGSVLPALSCQACSPNPPFARPLQLIKGPPLYAWELGQETP